MAWEIVEENFDFLLTAFIIKWRIAYECLHIDVPDTIKQETQVLGCQAVQTALWKDVEYAVA